MIFGAAWVAFIVIQAWQRWPQVPLDMGSGDPEVAAVYRDAVARHAVRAALLALVVPALLWGAFKFTGGGAKPSAVPATATASGDGPARILLMRHAEKTGNPEDMHLSDAGRARAKMLATYIPQTFGRPDAIFAARQSKRSNRSVETVEPLSAATGVALDETYDDDKPKQLIARLTSDPALAGKTIVVCWHHSDLPKLARALGAPEDQIPGDWDPEVFNLILDIRYGANGDVTVSQVTEPF